MRKKTHSDRWSVGSGRPLSERFPALPPGDRFLFWSPEEGCPTGIGSLLRHELHVGASAPATVAQADLDWANLGFGYRKTDYNIRYVWRDGAWDQGALFESDVIPLNIAATCLHYGQECFEGLKAYETRDGEVRAFRIEDNARRLVRSCRKICMVPVPPGLFIDAVFRVVNANRRFIPPYGTGASLYIRPLVLGSSARVGLGPAEEYVFLILVAPVGPYFTAGLKPIDLVIEESVDRAAPLGVGDVKVGGNYAAALRATMKARQGGYAEALYLDAREKRYIDETSAANFFAVTRSGQFVTPRSETILPSITNDSLISLAEEIGLRPVRRPVPVEELFDFAEAGCCGTAAVITPVGSITYRGRKIVYARDGRAGPYTTGLYEALTAIQVGDAPDRYGWTRRVPA